MLLVILAALWQTQRQELCYRLCVNFEGVSTTPNWSSLQKLLYLIDYEDRERGRFGWDLVAGNEFDFNRFPSVPPGPCKINFRELCYYENDEMGSERMKIVVDLPLPDSGDEVEVYAEECPGLIAVMADVQCRVRDRDMCGYERNMTPEEVADKWGMLYYPAESGDKVHVPFKDGKLGLHLIIKDEKEPKGWHAHSVLVRPLKK
ncbi:MAG: hypothetical protein IKV92_06320 [Akkermansia sp.]|nr:hypothetical protein [Akkermansia sp.]